MAERLNKNGRIPIDIDVIKDKIRRLKIERNINKNVSIGASDEKEQLLKNIVELDSLLASSYE